MNLIGALQRNTVVNATVKHLRLNRVVDAYLRVFPKMRRTSSGATYRIDSVPAWVVSAEVFQTDAYAGPLRSLKPSTFIDLGGNVGYFPVLLSEFTRSDQLRGLVLEPNPELHAQIEFHLSVNRLAGVKLVKAVAGSGMQERETDFYLASSHIASSVTNNLNPNVPAGGPSRKIRVAVADVAEEWARHFSGSRIGVLKIDIEGAELPFLRTNRGLLAATDAVLVEWHKWVTSLDDVRAELEQAGLRLQLVTVEDAHAGTAFFRR